MKSNRFVRHLLIFVSIIGFCQTLYAQSPDTTLANSLYVRGLECFEIAKYDSSIFFLSKASSLFESAAIEQNTDHLRERYLHCQNKIGSNWHRKGEYDKAEQILLKALKQGIENLGNNHLVVAESAYELGFVYGEKGQNDKMMDFAKQALEIRVSIVGSDNLQTSSSYSQLAMCLGNIGEMDESLNYQYKALELRQRILGDEHPAVASSMNNIAVCLNAKGDYHEAQAYIQRAIHILETSMKRQTPFMAILYLNLGNSLSKTSSNEKALEAFKKAMEILLDILGKSHPEIAKVYNNIGGAYLLMGKYDEAIANYQSSLSMFLETVGEQNPMVAEPYRGLGIAYTLKGQQNKALTYLNLALLNRKKFYGEKHFQVAEIYRLMGDVFEKQQQFQEAVKYYQKAVCTVSNTFNTPDVYRNPSPGDIQLYPESIKTLISKANSLLQLATHGDPKNRTALLNVALSTSRLSMLIFDKTRRGFSSEKSKIYLTSKSTDVYSSGVHVAWALYQSNEDLSSFHEIFEYMEKSKSSVLLEALANSKARNFSELPDSLLKKEKSLKIKMASLDTEIQKEYEKSTEKQNRENIESNQKKLLAVWKSHDDLINKFESDFPKYFNLKYQTKTATVPELQHALDAETALLEYYVCENALIVAAIDNQQFNIIYQAVDSTFHLQIQNYISALRTIDFDNYLQSATALYQTLISPVESVIKGKKQLVIIPGGNLNYLPFETLIKRNNPDADFTTLPYLLRDYTISYHYSATLFLNTNKTEYSDIQPLSFAGFAPVFADSDTTAENVKKASIWDFMKSLLNFSSVSINGKNFSALKYSENELKTIVKFYSENNLPSVGYFHKNADEARFKNQSGNATVIHVATHGIVNAENPALSGLIFAQPNAPSTTEDGILYASETYNLNLNANLIVLSSCESGLGKLVNGEGVLALTRGFLYAGARNIIHSLWKVNDKHTSELMIELYRQILDGKSYSNALRNAKLKLISEERTAFPASWASFVLIGE